MQSCRNSGSGLVSLILTGIVAMFFIFIIAFPLLLTVGIVVFGILWYEDSKARKRLILKGRQQSSLLLSKNDSGEDVAYP